MVNASLTAAKYERKFSPEDVLTKIRDDGDFDRLRLKIIRQLKDDAELRDKIIDMVKQSAALNQPGAETMKPRQLSDAIHQEIGEKVMSQISNGLWKVIRSRDGIKQEVTETVQLVYNKLANPNEYSETSVLINSVTVHKGHDNISNKCVEASSMDVAFSDCEPNEPPGFSLHNHQNITSVHDGQDKEMQRMEKSVVRSSSGEHTQDKSRSTGASERGGIQHRAPHLRNHQNITSVHDGQDKEMQRMEKSVVRSSRGEHTQDKSRSTGASERGGIQHRAPHGLRESMEPEQLDYGSDDGPDLPPGFS